MHCVVLPGTQIVTLTNAPFRYGFTVDGPGPAVMVTVLATGGGG